MRPTTDNNDVFVIQSVDICVEDGAYGVVSKNVWHK